MVHVLAAVGESVHYGEHLIGAMIHGRKRALGQDVAGDEKGEVTCARSSRPASR